MSNQISIARFQALFETELSPEQVAAVTAPLDGAPSLVVAGAGSGKTKVMALRAAWLVASGLIQPAEIIGLTFTRRAASELEKRIQQYLSVLKATETNPSPERFWPSDISSDAEHPQVSTYNSFAVELFEQRAVALGFEPDAQTLGEADAFRLARRVALNPGPKLVEQLTESRLARDTVIDSMLSLTHELADNDQTAAAARAYLAEILARLEASPLVNKGNGRHKYFQDLLDRVSEKILIAELANEYHELKRTLGYLEYSDQVVLALRGVELSPINHGFKAVLLDEYQDTSPIQARLLARVFQDASVMAVGDPRQAIYGWRGASAANLTEFFKDFGSLQREPGRVFNLTVNWRSDRAVVDAANVTAGDIETTIQGSSPGSKSKELSYSPNAAAGKAWYSVSMNQDEEAQLVAQWFRERLQREPNATCAILFRSRRSMAQFADALQQSGVRYSIFGLGGMLEMPEVADLVSALRVIFEIDSGIFLMRLLAGPRWRIGAGDIAALSKYAAHLTRNLEEFDDGPALTLTEALDDMVVLKNPPKGMSAIGFERLRDAAALFRKMRGFSGLGLSETARLIVEELQLDIETLVSALETVADPLRNLNSFYQLLDDYENRSVRPSMSDFLEWLSFAVEHERLEPPSGADSKGIVQLLTIHAAKGLEWQYVAIPNLVQDQFPAKARDNGGWLGFGKLPFQLRQDSNGLPEWKFAEGSSQTQVNASLTTFKNEMAMHRLAEERRVAYVAVTRAERELLLTASYWRRGIKTANTISDFLAEQIQVGHLTAYGELAAAPGETNPLDALEQSAFWPKVAAPERLAKLRLARNLVEAADPAVATGELAQLLAERRRRLEPRTPLLPRRMSASSLVALISNPIEFAQRLARPEPSEFSSSAQLGSAVHAALEEAFAGEDSVGFLAALIHASEAEDERPAAALLQNYLESDRARSAPEFVEHEVEFVLGPLIVSCKLDAVFRNEFGYEIIDWKTGAPPATDEELEERGLQLALYRVGLSELLQVPLERISAAFFFLATGEQIVPARLAGREQLEQKLALALRRLDQD